jgi:antibiotic biosynthesis monooxygenase (ABM) superfamily enzyme
MSGTPSSAPITVSIRREVDPARIAEATAWVQTGVNLASSHPGFLGSGWVRDGDDSHHWHMLYRFADEAALDAWEASRERAWWLSMGEGSCAASAPGGAPGSRAGSTSRRPRRSPCRPRPGRPR